MQIEDVDQLFLGRVGFGEHATGSGSSAGGGVDQDGLLDAGQGGAQFADGQVRAVLVGVAAYQVGQPQGQHVASTQANRWTRMLWSVQGSGSVAIQATGQGRNNVRSCCRRSRCGSQAQILRTAATVGDHSASFVILTLAPVLGAWITRPFPR